MKKVFTHTVLFIYGALILTIVFGILFLAFQYQFSLKFTFPLLGPFYGIKAIFAGMFTSAQHEFPHFGTSLVTIFICSCIIGFSTTTNLLIGKRFRLFLKTSFNAFKNYYAEPLDKNQIKYAFIAVTMVFVFCLCSLEIGLRYAGIYCTIIEQSGGTLRSCYDTTGVHSFLGHLPNTCYLQKKTEFTHKIRTNSAGFRDHEWLKQSKCSMRIAMFGDSFTEGVGAPQDSSYPSVLQRAVASSAEIMNFGVSGSDPAISGMLLKKKVVDYHPNIAILTFNSSDIGDFIVRGGSERFWSDGTIHYREPPWWEYFYVRFRVARLIAHEMFDVVGVAHLTKEAHEKAEAMAILQLEKSLDDFHIVCSRNGIRCICIFHPTQREVCLNKMLCDPVMVYAKSRGYEYIDMLAYFRQEGMTQKNAGNYFWPIDSHNNASGYQLFAKGIYEYLVNPCPISASGVMAKQ